MTKDGFPAPLLWALRGRPMSRHSRRQSSLNRSLARLLYLAVTERRMREEFHQGSDSMASVATERERLQPSDYSVGPDSVYPLNGAPNWITESATCAAEEGLDGEIVLKDELAGKQLHLPHDSADRGCAGESTRRHSRRSAVRAGFGSIEQQHRFRARTQ
ncbi:hypothetical protein [Actinoplanes sp. NPDC049265]|uniref:hypothetical protein n=1 Tax=Actinoplanes sp. NPDC049265 TaxID=3363902 RepID=UPI0037199604